MYVPIYVSIFNTREYSKRDKIDFKTIFTISYMSFAFKTRYLSAICGLSKQNVCFPLREILLTKHKHELYCAVIM